MHIAILLPLSSRNGSAKDTLANVKEFASTLETDTRVCGNYSIYVGVDEDDYSLDCPLVRTSIAESFKSAIAVVWVQLCPTTPFAACFAWRLLAQTAAEDVKNDLFVFLGEDIVFQDPTWYQGLLEAFKELESTENQLGFGVVALKEETSPSWPCFPVLERRHFDIFGETFPASTDIEDAREGKAFYNQEADPFLFELYRRYNCARFTSRIAICNTVGGVRGGLKTGPKVRYKPIHMEWRKSLLPAWCKTLGRYLSLQPKLTFDVVIPCFRLETGTWEDIVQLKSEHANVRFVLIVDHNEHDIPPKVAERLRSIELSASNVRIRVNDRNRGAPYSRSRGLRECHSEYTLFLDDDVHPSLDILDEYAHRIHAMPEASGFVGASRVPIDGRQSTTAFHLSQALFFWNVADWASENALPCPWGVTANLCVKWQHDLYFDERFPKTGGGEDVDFCILAGSGRGEFFPAPKAIVVHPWWEGGGRRALATRLVKWAIGDGFLMDKYKQYRYLNFPNVVEASAVLFMLLPVLGKNMVGSILAIIWMGDIVAGVVWIYITNASPTVVKGWKRFTGAFESNFYRIMSEFGHLKGHVERRNFQNICVRFDWFLGFLEGAQQDEIARQRFHCVFWLVSCLMWFLFSAW